MRGAGAAPLATIVLAATLRPPRRIRVGDTTGFVIGESAKMYFAGVPDLYSRFGSVPVSAVPATDSDHVDNVADVDVVDVTEG